MRYISILIFTILLSVTFSLSNTEVSAECKSSPHVWGYTYGGIGTEHFEGMVLASNGDLIVKGTTMLTGYPDEKLWILRLDPDGKIIWQKTFSCCTNVVSIAGMLIEHPDGNLVIAGNDADGIVVVKLTGNGELLWQQFLYDSGDIRFVYSITATQDGGVVLMGSTSDIFENHWLLKLDTNGDIVWKKVLPGKFSVPSAIIETRSGNLIISTAEGAGDIKMSLIVLSPDGSVISTKRYDGLYCAKPTFVMETGDLTYTVAGFPCNDTGDYGLMLELAANGDPIWGKTWGPDMDRPRKIAEIGNGEYMIIGNTYDYQYPINNYSWIMRLNSSGDIAWQKKYTFGYFTDLVTTPTGEIIVGGETDQFGAGNLDFFVMKVNNEGDLGGLCTTTDANFVGNRLSMEVFTGTRTLNNSDYYFIPSAYTVEDTLSASHWICPSHFDHYMPAVHRK